MNIAIVATFRTTFYFRVWFNSISVMRLRGCLRARTRTWTGGSPSRSSWGRPAGRRSCSNWWTKTGTDTSPNMWVWASVLITHSWMNDWALTDQCASFLMVCGQHIIIIHHPLLNIPHPMWDLYITRHNTITPSTQNYYHRLRQNSAGRKPFVIWGESSPQCEHFILYPKSCGFHF